MRIRLEVLVTSLFSVVLSVNLLLYSSHHYAPPRAESPSYSILDCTSHGNQGLLPGILEILTGSSDDENGTEKQCFCCSCCSPRSQLSILTYVPHQALEQQVNYSATARDFTHAEDYYHNLAARSPPLN